VIILEKDPSKLSKQDKNRYVCFNCKHLVASVFPDDCEKRPIIRCPNAIFGVNKQVFGFMDDDKKKIKEGLAVEYCKYQDEK